jgi:hypothetical protein
VRAAAARTVAKGAPIERFVIEWQLQTADGKKMIAASDCNSSLQAVANGSRIEDRYTFYEID